MTMRPGLIGLVLGLFALTVAAAAGAQKPTENGVKQQQERTVTQPGNNAPVWRDVRSGQPNYTSIKGRETNVLVQSWGDTWRRIRNGPVTFYGGWLAPLGLAGLSGLFGIFRSGQRHASAAGS